MDSPELIENPVLFFLHDKIDVVTHDDLISICASFYTEEEVKTAKQILRNLLKCSSDVADRRTDARKKNLSDIIRLLNGTSTIPAKFCITNTRRIPPVSIDHIDAAALLKNITDMRTEMLKYKFAQARQEESMKDSLNEQQHQIETLKATMQTFVVRENASHTPNATATTTLQNRTRSYSSVTSGNSSHTPGVTAVASQQRTRSRSSRVSGILPLEEQRSVQTNVDVGNSNDGGNTSSGTSGASNSTLVSGAASVEAVSSEVQSGRYISDSEGFLSRAPRMRLNRRPKPIRGSREGNKLRVSPAATLCHIWLSNLHVECSEDEVRDYVRELTGDDSVAVEKPQLKRTDSSAFIVTAHERHLEILNDPESWELHVCVRPYRPARQATATRNIITNGSRR